MGEQNWVLRVMGVAAVLLAAAGCSASPTTLENPVQSSYSVEQLSDLSASHPTWGWYTEVRDNQDSGWTDRVTYSYSAFGAENSNPGQCVALAYEAGLRTASDLVLEPDFKVVQMVWSEPSGVPDEPSWLGARTFDSPEAASAFVSAARDHALACVDGFTYTGTSDDFAGLSATVPRVSVGVFRVGNHATALAVDLGTLTVNDSDSGHIMGGTAPVFWYLVPYGNVVFAAIYFSPLHDGGASQKDAEGLFGPILSTLG